MFQHGPAPGSGQKIIVRNVKDLKMELELGSAIVGAVSLAVVALPVVLMSRSRRKKGKHFKDLLSELAAQHGCQIDQYEIAGIYAIGLDETRNFVFYCAEKQEKMEEQYVDLGKIQRCTVVSTGSMLKGKDGNHKVIDKLELSFLPIAKDKPEVKLEFFNADINPQLYGELQTVEKWSNLLNVRLKGKN